MTVRAEGRADKESETVLYFRVLVRRLARRAVTIVRCAVLTLFVASIFCPVATQAAEERSLINRAGEQRMLSQRIVKAYGMMALGTMTRQAAEQLRDSVARFEANMASLASASQQPPGLRQAREQLMAAWAPLRAKLLEAPTPEATRALARLSDEVLARAERLVLALEPTRGVPSAVNIAGRQRMLSQRVAKAYVLIALGLDTEAMRNEMGSAAELFAAGLDVLGRRPDNTPEIQRELEELSLQWEWLWNAIAMDGAVSYRLIVAEAAEALLQIAERLTKLYERTAIHGAAAHLRKAPS